MPHPCRVRASLNVLLLVLLAFLCAASPTLLYSDDGLPDVIPPGDQLIARKVARYLKEQHYLRRKLDDEISQRCFKSYLKALDPYKDHFMQSDIDEFRTQENNLDDMVSKGDLSFAYQVFRRYLARNDERGKWVEEFVDAEHDFGLDESWLRDPDSTVYARDEAEAKEKWRKRIKRELLELMVLDREEKDRKSAASSEMEKQELLPPGAREKELAPKEQDETVIDEPDDLAPVVEEDPRAKLRKRYQNSSRSLHQIDHYELLELFLSYITGAFDPHTSYMAPKSHESFDIGMRLELEGIGASLRSEDGYTVVYKIIRGGAADRDGRLQEDDKIVGVGEGKTGPIVDVVGRKLADVVPMIRGASGSTVRLEVIPKGRMKKRLYELTRAKVMLEDSAAKGEVHDYGTKPDGSSYRVGIVTLPSFYRDLAGAEHNKIDFKSTTTDVRKIIQGFLVQGIDAVVLDLRGNGGGALNEAIELTGLFIDQGPVVRVQDTDIDVHEDRDAGALWGGPLLVLTDKESASASEILAGAIQDYRRGLIVGDPATHGKGTVQRLVDLTTGGRDAPAGVLKLTTQMFFRPTGGSTQSKGVAADVVLPSPPSGAKTEAEIDYALPWQEIPGVEFSDCNLVPQDLLGKLRELSSKRVEASTDFQQVSRSMALYERNKDRKEVTLNEKKFIAERAEWQEIEDALVEVTKDPESPARDEEVKKPTTAVNGEQAKTKLDYYMKEALAIAIDYVKLGPWSGKKVAM